MCNRIGTQRDDRIAGGARFVTGGFGPAAFVAVFLASGPLLPVVLAVFASVLLIPGTLGPIVSALVECSFGWQALFLVQAAIDAVLALGAYAWVPHPKPDWSALKTDWAAIFLLSTSARRQRWYSVREHGASGLKAT
jgi:DHA2 family multidrug resistance protein